MGGDKPGEERVKKNYDVVDPLEMLENDEAENLDPKIFIMKLTMIQDKWRIENTKA